MISFNPLTDSVAASRFYRQFLSQNLEQSLPDYLTVAPFSYQNGFVGQPFSPGLGSAVFFHLNDGTADGSDLMGGIAFHGTLGISLANTVAGVGDINVSASLAGQNFREAYISKFDAALLAYQFDFIPEVCFSSITIKGGGAACRCNFYVNFCGVKISWANNEIFA